MITEFSGVLQLLFVFHCNKHTVRKSLRKNQKTLVLSWCY